MKTFWLVAVLCTVAYAQEELPLAGQCNEELCQLPDCRCASNQIPGGFAARDTPQFVTITFDDAVTAAAMPNYREMLFNRRNSNSCPTGATFYVSHEWTDYSAVNELYNNGFEIALHSISHKFPQTLWRDMTYDEFVEEFVDQRAQISRFANIQPDQIQGLRLPFLQLNGNVSFQVMKDHGLGYDASWGTIAHTNPGLWPYTLDYASFQDCPITPCPSASIPGAWVQPMLAWTDTQGFPCIMADACVFPPDRDDADAWFDFFIQNFERHYMGNRAPFGIYIHEAYFRGWPEVKRAVIRFLDLINSLHDVFMVNANEVLDWVKNPVSLTEYRSRPCRFWLPSACLPSFCAITAEHNNWNYYMTVCGGCPRRYPWVGNPLGL